MSEEKLKQPAVGDRGQRYEIWCDDEDGQPMQMGWSNNPESMKRAVELHPCWSNHRAVDRLGAAAVKSESASDADRPRSCPAHGSGALPSDEEEADREARIAADVFNPAESDLDYFLRRKRSLEEKRQNVRMSDAPPQPSDSPSACEARSTPSAGSEPQ